MSLPTRIILLGLLALGHLAIPPALFYDAHRSIWETAIDFGLFFGQTSLIATWAALGRQRRLVRVSGALVLAAYLWVFRILHAAHTSPGAILSDTILPFALVFLLHWIAMQFPLELLRRRGYRFGQATTTEEPVDERRYPVWHLFVLTAAMAVLLSVVRLVLSLDSSPDLQRLLEWAWEMLPVAAFVAGWAALVGLFSLWSALSAGNRTWRLTLLLLACRSWPGPNSSCIPRLKAIQARATLGF